MNDPQNATHPLHRLWWRGLRRLLARWHSTGALIGFPLYLVECALVDRLSEGHSTDLMICRKA